MAQRLRDTVIKNKKIKIAKKKTAKKNLRLSTNSPILSPLDPLSSPSLQSRSWVPPSFLTRSVLSFFEFSGAGKTRCCLFFYSFTCFHLR